MSEEKSLVWTRLGGNSSREPILIGRKISPQWLTEKIALAEFRFTGDLFNQFSNLLSLAKTERKNLPIVSLRTGLIAGIDKIVRLDRDLGLLHDDKGRRNAAIAMYPANDEDGDFMSVRESIASLVGQWIMNDLEPWAERHGMGALATSLKAVVKPEWIESHQVAAPLTGDGGGPDFHLIARTLAERLTGETLFDRMGFCELVASPESRSNCVELMTLPMQAKRGDDVFSMVARLTACTMPYSDDIFLGVSASKRVWSKRVPISDPKMPRRVSGYVMSAGRPAFMVPVERTESGWEFGDGYAVAQGQSTFSLPVNLAEAVQQRTYNETIGWWAGLPELPTLFKFVSPRTVFEGDEAALLETVVGLLGTVLAPKSITIREIPISRKKRPLQEMLRLADLDFGAAGDSLISEAVDEEVDDSGDDGEDNGNADRGQSLRHYRAQNIRALKLKHGDVKPLLWVLCNAIAEQDLIRQSVATLFGDAVDINVEPLPLGTHGLRADLDGHNLPARGRFDERLKRWEPATNTIQAVSAGRPIIALICAADKYQQRNEDSVNYYAGIHAMSRIGANVHHVLPIENPADEASRQGFLHRAQSALVDVFLAHSGIIFGTKEFAAQLLPTEVMPRCVYGLQAIRSRARNRSGETGVTFILNTRLVIETGVTEVQFVYRGTKGTQRSDWKPLDLGLQWLGSQRSLHDGDERWLREVFEDVAKETLLGIHESDPRAVVMIEWASLAGLWKGIRDMDLKPSNGPKLGNADLAVFKGLCLVRLRRGSDTLALRSAVKVSYEGWKKGEERTKTGEVFVDSYYATGKSLVEVSDESLPQNASHGHFIASMGYAKTVQVKRGYSCYRPTTRMQRAGKGAKEHEQKVLDPASMDASLPAAMEITVMSAPSDVQPRNVAMLAMGLRIGYAHYNEWTALPAPLFFRRKIEDYVIRFPEDDEQAAEMVAEEAVDRAAAAKSTFLSRLVDDETRKQVAKPEVVLPDIGQAEPHGAVATDLLSMAKAAPLPALHNSKDPKIRTVGLRMLQQNANVRVRVDLPYWVKLKDIFGEFTPNVRRNAQKCWDEFVRIGIIGKGTKRPRDREFLIWLADKLQVPQSAQVLAFCCSHIGGLQFVPFSKLIRQVYNPRHPKEEQVLPEVLKAADLEALAKWADANSHDEMMGWLVFQVAQFPSTGWRDAVLNTITHISGPLTEEALKYYLDVASAVQDAIAQCNHLSKFQTVLRKRTKPAVADDASQAFSQSLVCHVAPAQEATLPQQLESEAPTMLMFAKEDVSQQTDAIPNMAVSPPTEMSASAAPANQESLPVDLIKKRLTEIISLVVPGSPSFADALAEIRREIEALEVLHDTERDRFLAGQALRERYDSLNERCNHIIAKLELIREQIDLGRVTYAQPVEGCVDAAEESAAGIETIIGDMEAFQAQLANIDALPPTTMMAERQKRAAITAKASSDFLASGVELKFLLDNSCCFVADGVGTPGPGGGDDTTEDDDSVEEAPPARDEAPVKAPAAKPTAPEKVVAEPVALVCAAPQEAAPAVEEAPVAEVPPITAPSAEVVIADELLAKKSNPHVSGHDRNPVAQAVAKAFSASSKPEAVTAIAYPAPALAPTRLPQGAIQQELELDSDADVVETDPEVILHHTSVLAKLLEKRLYGLAAVHVAAMKPILNDVAVGESNTHYVVLRALADALYRIDCQFEFDPRIDPDLRVMLVAHPITGDQLCDTASLSVGILAASLSGLLFNPTFSQWDVANAISTRLTGHAALSKLLAHIDTIRTRHLSLTRDAFRSSHVGDQEAIKQELQRFQARAQHWSSDDEIFSNWNHRGFKRLHEEMFSPKGVIGACVDLIARGESSKVSDAYEEARRKFEKPSATVDDLYRRIGERTRPEGLYRIRAGENIELTRCFVENYLDLLYRKNNPNVELVKSTQAFLAALHRYLEESLIEVAAMEPETPLAKLYRDAAQSALRCALHLFTDTKPALCIPQDKQKLLVQLPLNHDLMPVIEPIDEATPALCNPLSVLDETSRWASEHLTLQSDGESIDEALQHAMNVHLDAQRFLPAFLINQYLPGNESIIQRYNLKKAGFDAELQQARQRVTHALTLSALTQTEANNMQRVIEQMLEATRPDKAIGHPNAETVVYADFPQAAAVLRYNVLMPLEARLAQVAARLEDELDKYAEESRGLSSPTDIQRVRAMLESSNAATLRTAYDALNLLRTTNRLPTRLSGPTDFATHYDEFIGEVHTHLRSDRRLVEELGRVLVEPASENAPAWLKALDSHDRENAVKILTAWCEMFPSNPQRRNTVDDTHRLTTLLNSIGISHEPVPFQEHGRPTRMRFALPERAFTFTVTADEDLFIPPSLGSQAKHIQGFMVFGQPQEIDLRQLTHEIAGTPTVIFARARLNMQKRAKICGSAPVLLLDDDLIAYIALHPAERFQSMMRIGMLTYSTNPYDDYGGRPVPTEMFFGRQTELTRLREVKSLGVLYGGRRLGKSSLLSQIELETRNTPNGTAVYISMDTIDSAVDHVLAAWEFLYRGLLSRKIINPMQLGSPTQWQAIRDWIAKELQGNDQLKSLYLLIDEADSLMGRELRMAKGDISFVRSLQQMVENLNHTCHIKYVIAGLHNMARMTTEENSVLGKADPIALEPFSSASDIQRGIRLITKPLAAMGFLFGEGAEDLPLRILSVCNFYPAFIQLYCKSLVDRLQNRRQDVKPPLYITASDLEAVEHDSNLLSELRRKFELNLDLDKRYKAIALILADTYYSEIEKGYYHGLTISDISNLCETVAPTHFQNAGDGVYEALLDEMMKLNVVERVGTRYILRNPNIAMMMGDIERVNHKLEELAKEPPEESRNRGERRIYIDQNGANRHLFPFPVAWVRRYMDSSDGELLVLTGNDLSGVVDLMKPNGRDIWKVGHDGEYTMLTGSGPMAAKEFVAALRRNKQSNSVRRIVAVRPGSWTVSQLPEFAIEAAKAAKQKIDVRFVMLAMPERAFELAAAIDAGTVNPETQNWRVVPVPPWSEDAVYFRLQENTEVSENSAALAAIIEASCGYDREIQRICTTKMSVGDALQAPTLAKNGLGASLQVFHKEIGLPPSFTPERRQQGNEFLELIDGAQRMSSEVDEMREMQGITMAETNFMHWMGLLQEGPGGTWKVPPLYANLIKGNHSG